MEDLSRFCCQNDECTHCGKRNIGNLTVTNLYGKNKQVRLLRCKFCKSRFSENKGTPYFNSRLCRAEVTNIMDHIREGNGIRRTGRLTNHSKNTVMRYSVLSGQHAVSLHNEVVAFSP